MKLTSIFGFIIFFAFSAFGQPFDRTFDNAAGTSNWSDPGNWVGGLIADDNEDIANMMGTPAVVDQNYTIHRLVVPPAQSAAVSISGSSALTIDTDDSSPADQMGLRHESSTGGILLNLTADIVIDNSGWIAGTGATVIQAENPSNSIEFNNTLTISNFTKIRAISGANIQFNGQIAGTANLTFATNSSNVNFGPTADNNGFTGFFAIYSGQVISQTTVPGGFVPSTSEIRVGSFPGTIIINGANTMAGAIRALPLTNDYTFEFNANQTNMGHVRIDGGNIVIDYDPSVTNLSFSNSSGQTWNGTLTINNFQDFLIRFGTDNTGLTATQLTQINIGGGGPVLIDNQGFLYQGCTLTDSGLNNIQCNDGGTPTDPSDDFITFELDPLGTGLGASYTITGATVTPGGANYGGPTTFSTNPGTAGNGDLVISIEDESGFCSLDETILDPGTCSNTCQITSSGLSNMQCNDGGTPSDPSDDYITFDLNPQGLNLATTYTVSGGASGGGSYGGPTSFSTAPGTAGGGNLSITITDAVDGGCTFSETITDPGTCSAACQITSSGLSNIQCNDGGTSSDPSDDFITFDLNPQGLNLATTYTISGGASGGGSYGGITSFSTAAGTAGGGNLSITITDAVDGGCTFSETITDPGACSATCQITSSGLSNIQCNNGGTPSDPSDDYITFDLNPQGLNLATTYMVSGGASGGGSYGGITSFSTAAGTAGGGNLSITITDAVDGGCTFSETITDPGTCSAACQITSSGLSNIQCNDGGTPSDPSDDYITFDLNPQGLNLATTYTISGGASGGGSYGGITSFSTAAGTAGGGNLSITISDAVDGGCTFSESITDPGTCSAACQITSSGLSNIQCNDGGTPSDPSDDYITFDLNPQGLNLATTYTVSGGASGGGSYGGPTSFSTAPGTAGGGNLSITITDAVDGGCTFSETITDPGTCSAACQITSSGLSNIQCNDGGTPSDPSDDYITFDLNPQGLNLATTYTVSGGASGGGSYGGPTSFSTAPGTAGGGNLSITITDAVDGGCTFSETITDPGTCSATCQIASSGLSNIQCNDGGTPSDPSDDFITFDLNPQGLNLGASYTIVGAVLVPGSGTYGTVTSFSTLPGTAGNGDLAITIQDDLDGGCTFSEIIIDPGTCSDACQLTTSGLTNIQCNDNGTPSDPTDDFITFDLDPQGLNLNVTYSVAGVVVIPIVGSYGTITSFSTLPGTAGNGDLAITIQDDLDGTCNFLEIITDPGTCSDLCFISGSGLTNIQCNDGGTPSDSSDDYFTFELNPTGGNTGSIYNILGAVVSPIFGAYGNSETFTTQPGTAGAGDLNIILEDENDANCTFSETIIDPGTCSNECELLTTGLTNVTCNDNGTPSDSSDDYITFDLNPTGNNLGSSYTLSGGVITPIVGNYGTATSYSTQPGTAGGGDLNLTIADDGDVGCTIGLTLTDPGTCSGTCNLTSSGLTNIQCNDNGTPSDPSDDYLSFDLDPSGSNLGSGYTLSGATVTPSGGVYGTVTSYETPPGTAGSGDLNITLTDDTNSDCTLDIVVTDPGACSNACELLTTGLTNVTCNDNGTPSDSGDDYITFDLNPTGNNLGGGYTLSGAVISPSGGNYGAVATYSTQPGTAGGGDLNLTITDAGDVGCTIGVTIADPGTCSGTCNLTSSGLTNIQCNDNGTPSDPSDDYLSFDLDPSGSNLGSGYTLSGATVTPAGGAYGAVISYETAPGTAGSGDLNITLTDDVNSDCTLDIVVTDPGACSDACELLTTGLTNITCHDNGTPSDSSDDYIIFDLNPTGNNLGTGYTLSGAVIIPSGGNYGTATSYSTQPGTAGGGDLNLTIADAGDAGCTIGLTLTDPGTCSGTCNLTSSGLTNIQCNDNGTPSDPSDDYLSFDLDPFGSNLGSGYTLSGATVTPSGGVYGTVTSYETPPGTAGSGDLNITLTDDTNSDCTLDIVVTDPGACSNACELLTTGLTNVTCNDNGTPSDSSDDFITFDLNPTGNNLGGSYTLSGAVISPSGGNYGAVATYSTQPGTAGGGDLNLTITDAGDVGCTIGVTIADPGTCSGTCNLTSSGLTNIQCNDNGTPSDPSDDYLSFDLDPFGSNLGSGYTLSGATVTPSGGVYGTVTSYETPPGTAGSGDLNITLTDDTNSDCTLDIVVTDPGTCSNACELLTTGLTNVTCNDNGTPSDSSDDFITFDLNPMGNNLGSSYTLSGGVITPIVGNYGTTTSFSTQPGTAGGGDLNLTITDDGDVGCTIGLTLTDPGTCSGTCNLTSSGLTNIQCNDNGTPSDPSDDYLSFDLDPSGSNLGSGYTLSGATVTPSGGVYGTVTSYETPPGTAGSGDLNITLTDDTNSDCTLDIVVTDPGACSNACELLTTGLTNVTCNDNGTPSDSGDDYITFDLNPTGNNLGGGYTLSGAVISPSGGNYGTATSYSTQPGTAGGGDINLTITDAGDVGCTIDLILADPGACSGTCNLTSSGLTNIQCNDNGTPSDPSDDYLSFDLDPFGSNLGSGYTLSGATVTPSGGVYGIVTSYETPLGTAGSGDLNITLTDDTNSDCTLDIVVTDPGTCSNACELLTTGLTNVTCNDNGTPSDSSDDFITFDLNPTGNNLGTGYTLSGAVINPSGGNYGTATSYSTQPGTAGGGDLNLTITDAGDVGCTIGLTLTDPGTCSGTCNLTSSGLTNIQCNDNGTPSDPSDDYLSFDLDPFGSNLGSGYTLSGATVTPSGGVYGIVTSYETPPGTAGSGDLNITLTDDTNSDCTLDIVVTDPGACSNACELLTTGLTNVTCNDNGTPSDSSDDYITFDLNPMGNNLGGGYTLSGAVINPSGGNYGTTTSYSTQPGTAGGGDLNLTITDDGDAGCTIDLILADPGACSGTCNLTSSGLTNIQCNDNGTPSDPSDDYITFDLDPSGSNLGSGYTLSGATVTPSGGVYGIVTSYETPPGTAGSGDLNITLTDDTNSDCTLDIVVTDPGACSNACELLTTGLTNVTCNDNGTPSDSSDDYITFDLNPMGNNLGGGYTLSGAVINPSGGNYGTTTSYSTQPGTAGGGDLNLTITDDGDAGCTIDLILADPGACSGTCNLTSSGLTNIQCNDNGTLSDPSDDYLSFDLDPSGSNLGSGYTLSGATVTPSGGVYGIVTSYETPPGTAGSGDLNITLTDDTNSDCTLDIVVTDPGACSNACELLTTGLTNVTCNDNGTPSDSSDDYITFDLNPTGNNLGTGYTLSGAVINPSGGNYGTATSYSTQPGTAGGGDLNLTITDDGDAGCTIDLILADPGACSGTCNLTSSGLTNIQCNDNGTPSDPSDDYITFDLDPSGSNLGSAYTLSGATVTPSGGVYGTVTSYETPPGTAGSGDLNITLTDDTNSDCTLDIVVTDPGACSNACELLTTGLTNVTCNDNGTPSDSSDDFITFDLNPMGNNLGSSYTLSGGVITPIVGNYGTTTSFSTQPGTAGGGDLNLTITDAGDVGCTIGVTIADPGTCSGTCNLTSSGLTNIQCNDNGTPSDPSDDYLSFDLDPSGSNLGSGYTLSGATVTPSGGVYGIVTSYETPLGTAGSGDLNITLTDDTNSDCTLDIVVTDPGTCSNACELLTTGLTNVTCNDNGTPSDSSDDYITFDLNPTGNNLGGSYTLSGGVISPSGGNYGAVAAYSTQPGTAGGGDLNLTITDDGDAGCTIDLILADPGACSGTCNLTSSGLTNIQCNDNGTPSDPSDDYITFDLDPSGSNLGSGYTLSGATVTPSGGVYGIVTSYETPPGTAGSGDLNITLTDDTNSDCTLDIVVADPGACSNACELLTTGLTNVTCNDNGTPSDSSDDFITFDLNPMGNNLGLEYTLTGATVMPSGGNYGSLTSFSTDVGTAGNGDLDITISDAMNGGCMIMETITDPGDCFGCLPFEVNLTIPISICEGETVDLVFNTTGGTAPITVAYFDGQVTDNVIIDGTGNFLLPVSPNSTTTYTITSIVDSEGCVGTPGGNATITVHENATSFLSDSFCEGQSYVLPDGTEVFDEDVYQVVLENQSLNGCDSIVTIELTQPQSYEFNESVVVCDSDIYAWQGQIYSVGGSYTMNFQTITGCDSTLVLNLTFDGLAAFDGADAGSDGDACGTEVDLFGQEVIGTIGIWTSPTGATIEPNNQAAAYAMGLNPAENIFIWTLSTASCPGFDSDTVLVYAINDTPDLQQDQVVFRNTDEIAFDILSNDDLNGISDFTVTCFDLPSKISSWDFDEIEEVLQLEVDRNAVGTFEFFYRVCSNECPDICDTTRIVLELIGTETGQTNYIITPENQDGLNDVLVFPDLDEYPNNALIIYNRWGGVLYQAEPYDNSWDGTRDGKRLPEADYYYILKKRVPDKIEYGNVTIKY